ncbi:MAG: helix-turn-helix domain-containing protein [Tannerella sp.]|nr:helix-turn-helix domain-containing protein [Tannerella sp.]
MLVMLMAYTYAAWGIICLFPCSLFMGVFFLLHLAFLVISYALPYSKLHAWLPLGIGLILLTAVPLLYISYLTGGKEVFFYIMVLPVVLDIFYPLHPQLRFILYVSCTAFLSFCVFGCEWMNQNLHAALGAVQLEKSYTGLSLRIYEIICLVPFAFAPALVFYSLYFLMKKQALLQEGLVKETEGLRAKLRQKEEITRTSSQENNDAYTFPEKRNELFRNIVTYFEKEKPYLDADFTIGKLGLHLGCNPGYISKAIRANSGVNFAYFLNTYRIRFAKENILRDGNRYNMEYFYKQAGFTNQSTFNRAFRQIEGITPSELISSPKAAEEV